MSSVRPGLYRWARVLGDVEAAGKGRYPQRVCPPSSGRPWLPARTGPRRRRRRLRVKRARVLVEVPKVPGWMRQPLR